MQPWTSDLARRPLEISQPARRGSVLGVLGAVLVTVRLPGRARGGPPHLSQSRDTRLCLSSGELAGALLGRAPGAKEAAGSTVQASLLAGGVAPGQSATEGSGA